MHILINYNSPIGTHIVFPKLLAKFYTVQYVRQLVLVGLHTPMEGPGSTGTAVWCVHTGLHLPLLLHVKSLVRVCTRTV